MAFSMTRDHSDHARNHVGHAHTKHDHSGADEGHHHPTDRGHVHHDHDQNGHDHGHAGHHHAPPSEFSALLLALILTLGFAGIEAVGGVMSGSLALLSDAGHMLSDGLALGMAAFAAKLAQRPPSDKHSYGLVRSEVLAAAFNALLMLVVVIGIAVESVSRLLHPTPVQGGTVIVIATIGLLVNIATALVLARAGDGLNIRAAMIHVVGDLLGSVAAILAGAIIWYTGWLPADPILSLLVVASILTSTIRLLLESIHVLMEGVPRSIDLQVVGRGMASIKDVMGVHDLHIWTLASGKLALSAHIEIAALALWPQVLLSLKKHLQAEYRIDHVTLQPESRLAFPELREGQMHIPIQPIE
jgi:cobalt-zinc-cadmium efflux system protein